MLDMDNEEQEQSVSVASGMGNKAKKGSKGGHGGRRRGAGRPPRANDYAYVYIQLRVSLTEIEAALVRGLTPAQRSVLLLTPLIEQVSEVGDTEGDVGDSGILPADFVTNGSRAGYPLKILVPREQEKQGREILAALSADERRRRLLSAFDISSVE